MPSLDEVTDSAAIHQLLIGPSKTGKTDFVAQAAIDGYQVLYFDGDNGLATLKDVLKNHPAAMKRIQYFNPVNLAESVESLLTMPVFRYNVRTGATPVYSDKPDDRIVEIIPSRIPKGLIFSLDSWTSFAYSLAVNRAMELKVSLTDIDKYSREIYGATGFLATQIALILQQAPFHVVVQAHGGYYERKEKPPGVASQISEKDMIIRETSEVPISTSMPHGATLPKYFNQIGWLSINKFDQRVIDYTAKSGRIGSGTPNTSGDAHEKLRFSQTFGAAPKEYPPVETWLAEMTYEEMKAKAQAGATFKPKAATAPTQATPAPAPTQAAPTKPAFLRK